MNYCVLFCAWVEEFYSVRVALMFPLVSVQIGFPFSGADYSEANLTKGDDSPIVIGAMHKIGPRWRRH